MIKSSPVQYATLSERQKAGFALYERAEVQNTLALKLADENTLWFSQTDSTRAYQVERSARNRRGSMVIEYRCQCPDFMKHGAIDCKHIFAEKLRRGDVVLTGTPTTNKSEQQTAATRGPNRERHAHDGRTVRSAQRSARRRMPIRIPELATSLVGAHRLYSSAPIAIPSTRLDRGGRPASSDSQRTLALVTKVACGLSASEMMPEYDRMIRDGILALPHAPSENTLSRWMNDEKLTPVLKELLRLSATPFREREIAGMVDSSKVSQLMIAHAKEVEYNNHDKRPGADWMKCHALVGVETLIVIAVEFSGTRGSGTHDLHFLKPLVEAGLRDFPLRFLLADKAYLTEEIPEWLASRGIQAVIPLRKRWFQGNVYAEALTHLIEWFNADNNRPFHAAYRFRSKIEGLFSILKRVADGYCWSRGRKREWENADQPCTAWINEMLCKFIYINLRATVTLEEQTGVTIDYRIPSRRFPPPDEPLLGDIA